MFQKALCLPLISPFPFQLIPNCFFPCSLYLESNKIFLTPEAITQSKYEKLSKVIWSEIKKNDGAERYQS